MQNPRRRYETGQIFNGIELLEPVAFGKWKMRCHCGREWVARASPVGRGETKQCGCLNSELSRVKATKHGQFADGRTAPLARIYSGMKTRCYNRKCPGYPDYGGRGIRVCDEWLHSLMAFVADMGPRPPGGTLDRIDVNGDYEPGNCRWLNYRQQNRNKRKTRMTEDGRVLKTVAEQEAVDYKRLLYFHAHKGIALAEALALIRSTIPKLSGPRWGGRKPKATS